MKQVRVTSHVIVRKKKSGVAFLFLDSPGSQNYLTTEVFAQLQTAVLDIKHDAAIKAVVIISGKHDTFCAGADLHQILRYQAREDGETMTRVGHQSFNALAELGKPTVAAINGACLGGGLELALCCRYRIATDAPNTVLGLPEITYGLIPALGGSQRLPRLIGVRKSLELILAGKRFQTAEALGLGIIDLVEKADCLVPRAEQLALRLADPAHEEQTAQEYIAHEEHTAHKEHTAHQLHTTHERLKDRAPVDDENLNDLQKLFKVFRRSIQITTKPPQPAKLRILDVMEAGLISGMTAGLEAEIAAFADLSVSPEARNLIFLYFSKELIWKQALKLTSDITEHRPLVLLDTGADELDTSHWLSNKIAAINQQHSRTSTVAPNIKFVNNTVCSASIFDSKRSDANGIDGDGIDESHIDGVIVQRQRLEQLAPGCCAAGIKLENPAEQIPFVEIVRSRTTSAEALARVVRFALQIKKMPLIVEDKPGFLLNRLVAVYLQQADKLAASGIPIEWIERAAVDFGMPVGPFSVLDEVGFEQALSIATDLNCNLSERFEIPEKLKFLIADGLYGKRNGAGVYHWQEGQKIALNEAFCRSMNYARCTQKPTSTDLKKFAQKMILPMVDEGARCLEEKVVRRARELDLATVLALGFPAARGGLLRYADSLGISEVLAEINEIYQESAPANRISDYLMRLKREKRGFYSRAMELV